MKTINITRWHLLEDDYVDVTDGAVPRKGDRVGYASTRRRPHHVVCTVQEIDWEVEAHEGYEYVRVMAIVRLKPA